MPSLFSDPPFPRGTTLLNKEVIDLDPSGIPIAGGEIVGQVKAFQDVAPGTGPAAVRYSNRIVYCVAARYTPVDGVTSLNPGDNGADKGKTFVLDRRGPLTTFSSLAAATDITDGRTVGVLDEYLTTAVRPNDIVWLVVRGPTAMQKAASIAIPGGLGIELASSSTGLAIAKVTTANLIAQCIEPVALVTTTAASTTGASATVAVSFPTSALSLVVAGEPITGHANLPANAYVSVALTSVVTSGATTTATMTIAGTTATAVPSGTTLYVGGPLYAATSVRANIIQASF